MCGAFFLKICAENRATRQHTELASKHERERRSQRGEGGGWYGHVVAVAKAFLEAARLAGLDSFLSLLGGDAGRLARYCCFVPADASTSRGQAGNRRSNGSAETDMAKPSIRTKEQAFAKKPTKIRSCFQAVAICVICFAITKHHDVESVLNCSLLGILATSLDVTCPRPVHPTS